MMAFTRGSVARLALLGEVVLLGAKMLRKIIRIGDTQTTHLLLLFRWTRFACRQGRLEHRRWHWSNGLPFVQLLTEEVGLMGKENLGAFDLAEIEALCRHFLSRDHHGVDERLHEVPERLARGNELLEDGFFFRLER